MTSIEQQKHDLRQAIKQRRNAVPPMHHADASRRATDRLLALLASLKIQRGTVVGLFWPLGDEIDTRPLITELQKCGFVTALPKTVTKAAPLRFHLHQAGDRLVERAFGVMEPDDQTPVCLPDIVVVPLLGFDHDCYRIGYGGGFYDRTIPSLRAQGHAQHTIGFAFACQTVSGLPRDRYDVALDCIVTEDQTLMGPLS